LEEGIAIDEGSIGVRNWPSSTKPELLAIWYVLLMTPRKRKIKVHLDSLAAIKGLEKGKKIRTSRQWLKEKGYDIKKSIIELIEIKELEIDLVKVKRHRHDKWNSRADKLAKEGSKIDNKKRIISILPPNSNVSLC